MQNEGFRMTERKDRSWIEALSDAAHIGIADVNARRMQSFDSCEQLDRHFGAIAEDAIASVRDERRDEERGFRAWLDGMRRQT